METAAKAMISLNREDTDAVYLTRHQPAIQPLSCSFATRPAQPRFRKMDFCLNFSMSRSSIFKWKPRWQFRPCFNSKKLLFQSYWTAEGGASLTEVIFGGSASWIFSDQRLLDVHKNVLVFPPLNEWVPRLLMELFLICHLCRYHWKPSWGFKY